MNSPPKTKYFHNGTIMTQKNKRLTVKSIILITLVILVSYILGTCLISMMEPQQISIQQFKKLPKSERRMI